MAGRKRRKRRAHRAHRSAAGRSNARPRQTAAAVALARAEQKATPIRQPAGNGAPSPKLSNSGAVDEVGRSPVRVSLPLMPASGRLGPVRTALLPGRVFFSMGRPIPGFVCCVLQASLLAGCRPRCGRFGLSAAQRLDNEGSRRVYGRSEACCATVRDTN